jgi:bacterioferritin-associated ferredoxin
MEAMATLLEVAAPVAPGAPPRRGPAMTRCECAGLSFEEIGRRLREEGQGFGELSRRTGCAATCTACVADLDDFLARRRP